MMSWSVSVYSSMVSEVGWDSDSNEILVTWARSGKRSAYAGADESVALELSKAPSVGQMIHQEIRPYYAHRYV